MKNFSKRMTTLLSKVEERSYSPIEAIKLVKENANAKFDETIEAHIRLGIDPKYTDQQLQNDSCPTKWYWSENTNSSSYTRRKSF